jgi:hypothetical protein
MSGCFLQIFSGTFDFRPQFIGFVHMRFDPFPAELKLNPYTSNGGLGCAHRLLYRIFE